MVLTVELSPEIERALAEKAAAKGMDVSAYATHVLGAACESPPQEAATLVELFERSPLKGLDLDFSRTRSRSRSVEL